ncbi:MAG: hypothetical protein QM674_06775 [Burkholderiaceae bacterium]
MNRDRLFKLFEEARRITGHVEYVIIGSLSILGTDDEPDLPADMTMSIDVDSFSRNDPIRIFDLNQDLGEDSPFHHANGYHLDPVSPGLPTLPDGWRDRMTPIARQGLTLWFIDPDDAAISKYARGDPNDLRWIRAGLRSGHVSLPRVRARLASTSFLDDAESARVRQAIDVDAAWFDDIRGQR